MATIGKVSAVFTASTSGLTSGVKKAANSFRQLGGDAGALTRSMEKLEAIKLGISRKIVGFGGGSVPIEQALRA